MEVADTLGVAVAWAAQAVAARAAVLMGVEQGWVWVRSTAVAVAVAVGRAVIRAATLAMVAEAMVKVGLMVRDLARYVAADTMAAAATVVLAFRAVAEPCEAAARRHGRRGSLLPWRSRQGRQWQGVGQQGSRIELWQKRRIVGPWRRVARAW